MQTIQDHSRALEYDLMTRTGRTLDEYMSMGASGKVALISFIENLPRDSALKKEIRPIEQEEEAWNTTATTNNILADLIDIYTYRHKKKGAQHKPYPRPGQQQHQVIGKDAIPISEFWEWWNEGTDRWQETE